MIVMMKTDTIYTGAEEAWYDGLTVIVMELMTTTKMEMAM